MNSWRFREQHLSTLIWHLGNLWQRWFTGMDRFVVSSTLPCCGLRFVWSGMVPQLWWKELQQRDLICVWTAKKHKKNGISRESVNMYAWHVHTCKEYIYIKDVDTYTYIYMWSIILWLRTYCTVLYALRELCIRAFLHSTSFLTILTCRRRRWGLRSQENLDLVPRRFVGSWRVVRSE